MGIREVVQLRPSIFSIHWPKRRHDEMFMYIYYKSVDVVNNVSYHSKYLLREYLLTDKWSLTI